MKKSKTRSVFVRNETRAVVKQTMLAATWAAGSPYGYVADRGGWLECPAPKPMKKEEEKRKARAEVKGKCAAQTASFGERRYGGLLPFRVRVSYHMTRRIFFQSW